MLNAESKMCTRVTEVYGEAHSTQVETKQYEHRFQHANSDHLQVNKLYLQVTPARGLQKGHGKMAS